MKALFFLIKFLQQNILWSCSLFTVSQAPRLWSRYQDFDRINQREEMMEVQSAVFIPAKAPNYMDEEGPNSEAKHYYNTLKNYTYLIKTAQYSAFNITLIF